MTDMLIYIGLIVLGAIVGSKVRAHREKLWWTSKCTTVCVVCLVIFMGSRMGCNEEIIENIGTIGLTAFVMTVIILAATLACLMVARKCLGFDHRGRLEKTVVATEKDNVELATKTENVQQEDSQEKGGINKMTIFIFCAVVVGMAIGYFIARPYFGENIGIFDGAASKGIQIALCCLMVFIGVDLGLEGTFFKLVKESGIRMLVFPVVAIVGTLAGALISGLVFGLTMKESLAIGAGFGWYSLAPGLIMNAGLLIASAISFLHNVMREIISILFIPLIAEKIGYIEASCISGAPAMDVCLPVISSSTKGVGLPYGLIVGIIMSFSVPILEPIILAF